MLAPKSTMAQGSSPTKTSPVMNSSITSSTGASVWCVKCGAMGAASSCQVEGLLQRDGGVYNVVGAECSYLVPLACAVFEEQHTTRTEASLLAILHLHFHYTGQDKSELLPTCGMPVDEISGPLCGGNGSRSRAPLLLHASLVVPARMRMAPSPSPRR